MMKVSAVSFASAANSKIPAKVNQKNGIQACNNPYKLADIMPITVGLGAGLMFVYALKSGKLDPVTQKIKGFMKIA